MPETLWEGKQGEIVANVVDKDGMVCLQFPLLDRWFAMDPLSAEQVAMLLIKYAAKARENKK